MLTWDERPLTSLQDRLSAAMKNADVRNDKGTSSRGETRRNLRSAGSLTCSVPLRS
jgi:hypothetical protein